MSLQSSFKTVHGHRLTCTVIIIVIGIASILLYSCSRPSLLVLLVSLGARSSISSLRNQDTIALHAINATSLLLLLLLQNQYHQLIPIRIIIIIIVIILGSCATTLTIAHLKIVTADKASRSGSGIRGESHARRKASASPSHRSVGTARDGRHRRNLIASFLLSSSSSSSTAVDEVSRGKALSQSLLRWTQSQTSPSGPRR